MSVRRDDPLPGASTASPQAANGDESFFGAYYGTHLAHRKGPIDSRYLDARARYFDRTWSELVPADRSGRILDAGCGVGAVVEWLHRRGYERAEGIDVSAELIELGSALGVSNLHCGDIRTHLRDTVVPYDCIVFRDILEHFPRAEIIELVRQARRALVAGGTVIVQVPNAEAPIGGRIRYGDFTHEIAFTESSLRQLLAATGFRPLRFAPAGPVAEAGRALPRYLLWKAIEVAYKILLYGVSGRRRAIVTESIVVVATRDGMTEQT